MVLPTANAENHLRQGVMTEEMYSSRTDSRFSVQPERKQFTTWDKNDIFKKPVFLYESIKSIL